MCAHARTHIQTKYNTHIDTRAIRYFGLVYLSSYGFEHVYLNLDAGSRYHWSDMDNLIGSIFGAAVQFTK